MINGFRFNLSWSVTVYIGLHVRSYTSIFDWTSWDLQRERASYCNSSRASLLQDALLDRVKFSDRLEEWNTSWHIFAFTKSSSGDALYALESHFGCCDWHPPCPHSLIINVQSAPHRIQRLLKWPASVTVSSRDNTVIEAELSSSPL